MQETREKLIEMWTSCLILRRWGPTRWKKPNEILERETEKEAWTKAPGPRARCLSSPSLPTCISRVNCPSLFPPLYSVLLSCTRVGWFSKFICVVSLL